MKIFSSLLLVILLCACQREWVRELVTQPGQPLYQQDFSDPGMDWPQTDDENGSLGVAGDAYRIQVDLPHTDLWALTPHQYADTRLETDVSMLAGPLSNRYGLLCRFADGGNFYVFFISSDGYYALGKVTNGSISLLGQDMMAYSSTIQQGNAPNHLRLDCVGDTLTAVVNGQVIATARDGDFTLGNAGLIAGSFELGGVEISFDDLSVIKP